MNKHRFKILIIAHNNLGTSLSGGDQIFLNLIKYCPKNFSATLVGSSESFYLLNKYHVSPDHKLLSAPFNIIPLNTFNLFFHQIKRVLLAFKYFFAHKSFFNNFDFIYTASDFPSDAIFGILSKIFYPKIIWIAGFYLFAPLPFSKNSPYLKSRHILRGLFYYLGQLPIYLLIKHLSNIVFVTSAPDTKKFPHQNTFIIRGGVFLPNIKKYKKSKQFKLPSKRFYDAVFLGRLHSQKGVLDLVDIWNYVIKDKPKARLAIIGDGELKSDLIKKIHHFNLNNNIFLLGFLTGQKKYNIFKNSKLILHPATYDSGGMAPAEAMAWGLPCISYNLEALKTYYPQGVLKTPCFDKKAFSQNILNLLNNRILYDKISSEAIFLTHQHWGWKNRIKEAFTEISNPEGL